MQTTSNVERNFMALLFHYLIGSELCFRQRSLICLSRMVCWLELEVKKTVVAVGMEGKRADWRDGKGENKGKQCLVHRQEDKGNRENDHPIMVVVEAGKRVASFFRRGIWFPDTLVEVVTEHLGRPPHCLLRNGHLELLSKVRDGSKGLELPWSKVLGKLDASGSSEARWHPVGGARTEAPGFGECQ